MEKDKKPKKDKELKNYYWTKCIGAKKPSIHSISQLLRIWISNFSDLIRKFRMDCVWVEYMLGNYLVTKEEYETDNKWD